MKTANLIKYDAVELDDGSILFIMNFTAKGLLDRCILKVDSKENWKKVVDALITSDPARDFSVEDLGIVDNPYNLKYTNGAVISRAYAYKLLNCKFFGKKLRKPSDFVNEEFYMMGNVTKPYLRKYAFQGSTFDVIDMISIPKGLWFSADKERHVGHRKPKVIM